MKRGKGIGHERDEVHTGASEVIYSIIYAEEFSHFDWFLLTGGQTHR